MIERTYPNDAETLACVARMKNPADTQMNAAELARLREIAQKATPGSWELFNRNGVRAVMKSGTEDEIVQWTGFDGSAFPEKATKNASHIAAFDPPTVLSLIDALEKARGEMAAMRAYEN